MQHRAIAQILTTSATVALVIAAAIFASLNDKTLVLLETSLSHNGVERICIGSVFWDFRTMGTDHLVFVPPARLQQTFNVAMASEVPIQYDRDLVYWLLLAACFLPSLTICAFTHPKASGMPKLLGCKWLLVPVCILVLTYSLGLRVVYHTRAAQITFQLRPAFNAVAIERWPIDGSNPTVWVSHLRKMSICTHKTSTCAGHICGEQCKARNVELGIVAADNCFPFNAIND
jgi:hypothetical protein